MNQILKNKKNKIIKVNIFFKIQLVISLILILIFFFYVIDTINKKTRSNTLSNIVKINAKLSSIYFSNKEENYFGKLIISKINLDYYIYNQYSEELLKILPCKFSGGKINQPGNICIIGHNYFDNTFFSNLYKLEKGDSIILEDLYGNKYKYIVYTIYECDEKEINEVVKNEGKMQILTLCTCTLNKHKRLIVKAKRF